MADEKKPLLQYLRENGIKSIKFGSPLNSCLIPSISFPDGNSYQVSEVEFFPSIAPLDLDTLVPAAPEGDEAEVKLPPAMERILRRGSVS